MAIITKPLQNFFLLLIKHVDFEHNCILPAQHISATPSFNDLCNPVVWRGIKTIHKLCYKYIVEISVQLRKQIHQQCCPERNATKTN